MKKGEKGIIVTIVIVVVAFGYMNHLRKAADTGEDKGIPFYTTAPKDLQKDGGALYKRLECRNCHTLWGIRNPMQSVPAPSLDGIGSIRSEQWLSDYLSAEDPGLILPSRLRVEYQMPSYAFLSEAEHKILVSYLSSLKVEDWYLPEARKAHYEKLTGKVYQLTADSIPNE